MNPVCDECAAGRHQNCDAAVEMKGVHGGTFFMQCGCWIEDHKDGQA